MLDYEAPALRNRRFVDVLAAARRGELHVLLLGCNLKSAKILEICLKRYPLATRRINNSKIHRVLKVFFKPVFFFKYPTPKKRRRSWNI